MSKINKQIYSWFYAEMQKVLSSASVLMRKDFRIRETLRKGAGEILKEEKRKERKELYQILSGRILLF